MMDLNLVHLLCFTITLTTLSGLARASELLGDANLAADSNDLVGGNHERLTRSLLAVPTPDPTVLPGHFLSYENCLFFFNNGVNVILTSYTVNKDTNKLEPSKSYNFTLDKVPTNYKASCANVTLGNPNANLTLDYGQDKISSKDIKSVKITLSLKINHGGKYWIGGGKSTIEVQSTNSDLNKNLALIDSEITASQGFSFSCSQLKLRSPRATNSTAATISLTWKRFQIQPFSTNMAKMIFADSFDCSTWFTISLWVGLFITILFGAIISLGIFMLFEIKTMDRFENPKGKTITVVQGD
jgi:hypothetical protein